MADVTLVNGQVTDAVTQANVTALGSAPAQSLGTLYQTVAHSVSLALVSAQQAQAGLAQIANAVTASAVATVLGSAGRGERGP